MARLCRLPRVFPLIAAAAASTARRLPTPANPSPALLFPSFSSPTPAASLPALSRLFSSSAGGSGMVVVRSTECFDSFYSMVQDKKLSAVFYYTAVWCGPCKAIAPVIDKLNNQYPKIPMYKVDIDLDGVGSKLSELKIYSVPTFHFYHEGQKTNEVIGATVKELEAAMETLDKQLAGTPSEAEAPSKAPSETESEAEAPSKAPSEAESEAEAK